MVVMHPLTASPSSANSSNMNQTHIFDFYCTTLLIGPLVSGIFSVPCACVGVPASVWLLWVLIQRQRSGLSNDIYMLNITIMDLIFNFSILPCTINFLLLHSIPVMMLTKFIYCFTSIGRPLIMVFICLDCYMAVLFPITYRKRKKSKHRIVVCALVWGLTLLLGLIFVLNNVVNFFTTSFYGISYALTIPIITFCDFSILYVLRKPDPSGRSDVHPQKQRALQTITNSFVMTIFAYLPALVVYSMSSLIPLSPQEMLCKLSIPTLIFPILGSTIMPLMYLGNLGSLRNLDALRCHKSLTPKVKA